MVQLCSDHHRSNTHIQSLLVKLQEDAFQDEHPQEEHGGGDQEEDQEEEENMESMEDKVDKVEEEADPSAKVEEEADPSARPDCKRAKLDQVDKVITKDPSATLKPGAKVFDIMVAYNPASCQLVEEDKAKFEVWRAGDIEGDLSTPLSPTDQTLLMKQCTSFFESAQAL